MTVYVATAETYYEGSKILGVYRSEEDAKTAHPEPPQWADCISIEAFDLLPPEENK